jgi:hypothetical protein
MNNSATRTGAPIMKKRMILSVVVALCLATSSMADPPKAPPGAKSSFETLDGQVLKVYSAGDGEYRFVAYVVIWKGVEVIVSDPLAKSDFNAGDKIKFMAQKIELANSKPKVATLHFTVLPMSPRANPLP